jgi:hypothetical protein
MRRSPGSASVSSVTALFRPGCRKVPRPAQLPELGSIEFVVAGTGRALRSPANALAAAYSTTPIDCKGYWRGLL